MRPVATLLAVMVTSGCSGGADPETIVETRTLTTTETVTVTHTVTEPGPTAPAHGHWQPVLTQLGKVFDDKGAEGTHGVLEDHMHVDEVQYRESDQRFFYCAYTFGVVDVSDPADPEYLAQGFEWDLDSPVGRDTGCLHVDWDDADEDIVYVSHRGNYDFQPHLSVVDLNTTYDPYDLYLEDPFYDPILHDPLQEPDVSYEGLDAENGLVYVALHAGGIGVFQRDPLTNEMSRVGGEDTLVPNAYDIEVVGNTAYVVDEQLGLYVLDVTDPNGITELGYLFIGGVDRDLAVDGDYAYIAGGGAGLVIVDISDPANPAVVSTTDTFGTAVRLGYDDGRVAVAAWNDTRVYDVSDPAAPTIIGAARLERTKTYAGDDSNERPDITARTLGVDLHGDDLFIGNWMTPYVFKIHEERTAPYLVLPEDIFYMGIGTVPVGDSGEYSIAVRNEGTAPLQILDAWADDAAFLVEPTSAEVPPGGRVDLTITYTATDPSYEETAIFNLLTDDPAQPLRQGYVVGNAEGIGIGDPLPFTEATDVNTLATWTSDQLQGQVALLAYFATF